MGLGFRNFENDPEVLEFFRLKILKLQKKPEKTSHLRAQSPGQFLRGVVSKFASEGAGTRVFTESTFSVLDFDSGETRTFRLRRCRELAKGFQNRQGWSPAGLN